MLNSEYATNLGIWELFMEKCREPEEKDEECVTLSKMSD